MSLFQRRFREEFHSLLTWAITLLLTGLAMMLLGLFITNTKTADSFTEILQKMPPAIQNMFGGKLTAGFSTLYLLGMAFNTIAPILLLVYASLAVLGLYTREAGQGNLEFLFSLPLSRFRLITQRIAVFLVNLCFVHLCFTSGVILGALSTGLKLNYAALTWATIDLFLLYFCLGGFAFLLSLSTNDYSHGTLLVLGILLGLFLLNVGLGDAKNVLVQINPYHYHDASRIFSDVSVPWLEMFGFTLAGLVFWSTGIGIYLRKPV